jgi:dolichol-phosphate mannosyltransferase
VRRAIAGLCDPAGNVLTHEIIVVDAGSKDDTLARAREAGATTAFVQKERGYGPALREGFAAARGRYVITMDTDLSHDPALIPSMMAKMGGADVVIASRYVKGGSSGGSRMRRALSVVLNRVYGLILWLPPKDLSSGYRIYDRRFVQGMEITCRNFDALEEIIVRAYLRGARFAEAPLNYKLRLHGESHARIFSFGVSYAKTLLKLFRLRYFSRPAV